jgi:hypothetical protein
MSKRRRPTALSTLLRALLVIRGTNGCENSTTGGFGDCFRRGRTIGAKYGAYRACDACIAHRAIELAKDRP